MGTASMYTASDELVGHGDVLSLDERRQLATSVSALRHTYDSRWPRIPWGFANRSRVARERLSQGLVPVDVATADPLRLQQELGTFVHDTIAMADRVHGNAELLGDALHADLSAIPLAALRRICHTLLRLADAPPPNPAWSNAAEAYGAHILLDALGDDLREVADVRRRLYEEFSEDVWALECAKQPPQVERWWQSTRRRRVRAELALVTRDGHAPADVKRSVATLRRAVELRASIGDAWAAVSGRLGHFADAGIPDVDGAVEALSAFHDLHRSLAGRVESRVLRDLAAADAFVCEELAGPAGDIVLTVTTWAANARRMKAATPLVYTIEQLRQWAAEMNDSLELVAFLKDATGRLRAEVRTVGEIFDDTVLRDRVHALCETGATT